MTEDSVGDVASKGTAGSDSVKLPDSVYDDAVKAVTVGAQPGFEPRSIGVSGCARSTGMDGTGKAMLESILPRTGVRRIGRGNLDLVAQALMSQCKDTRRLAWTACIGVQCSDDMEQAHGLSIKPSNFEQEEESGEIEHNTDG
jgi:hypothetical protein